MCRDTKSQSETVLQQVDSLLLTFHFELPPRQGSVPVFAGEKHLTIRPKSGGTLWWQPPLGAAVWQQPITPEPSAYAQERGNGLLKVQRCFTGWIWLQAVWVTGTSAARCHRRSEFNTMLCVRMQVPPSDPLGRELKEKGIMTLKARHRGDGGTGRNPQI